MDEITKIKNGKGYSLTVERQCRNQENPREYSDSGYKMVYSSRKYINLGDFNFQSNDAENWTDFRKEYFKEYEEMESLEDIAKHFYVSFYSMYDHSGINLELGVHFRVEEWDKGIVGFIYVLKEKEISEEKFEENARAEINLQNLFLRGDNLDCHLTVWDVCECCGNKKTDSDEDYYYNIGYVDPYDLFEFEFELLKDCIQNMLGTEVGDCDLFTDQEIKKLTEIRYVY